jgi:RNA polymerase sigma-32 factor
LIRCDTHFALNRLAGSGTPRSQTNPGKKGIFNAENTGVGRKIVTATIRVRPFPSRDQDLQRYLRQVLAFPLLDYDEEVALAKRAREHGDIEARERLVTSHLRLVVKVARRYRGYGLPTSELIAEGNVGLVQAVSRFDPDRGFRLATYAFWCIRAAIQDYILRNWSMVRVVATGEEKKLFFRLSSLQAKLKAIEDGELTAGEVDKVVENLQVSTEKVVWMSRRLAARDRSLNASLSIDGKGEREDWLVDEQPSPESRVAEEEELSKRRSRLRQALTTLTERERRILVERRLKDGPPTLNTLSKSFNLNRETVRRIELAAYGKVKRAVRHGSVNSTTSKRLVCSRTGLASGRSN